MRAPEDGSGGALGGVVAWPRLAVALPVAAMVTVGLFLVMRALVAPEGPAELEAVESVAVRLTRTDREEDTRQKERELTRPEARELPPPPPPAASKPQARPDLGAMTIPVAGGLGLDFNLAVGAPQDRNVQPKIRVPPEYPARALNRGIEGWVELEFTVDEQGNVVEPRVVRADPESVFDRAALRAVRKFKYNPKVVNGDPVRQTGIRFLFQFEIEDKG